MGDNYVLDSHRGIAIAIGITCAFCVGMIGRDGCFYRKCSEEMFKGGRWSTLVLRDVGGVPPVRPRDKIISTR